MYEAIQTMLIELKLKGLSRNNLRKSDKKETFLHAMKVISYSKFLEDISPFCWTTGTPFLTFGNIHPNCQSQSESSHLFVSLPACNVTPVDLFVANMATAPFTDLLFQTAML